MFQFPKSCLLWTMNSSRDHRLSPAGLPHSEISGSQLVYSLPKLIAVSHVLLRLLMPRHSPSALSSLALFYKYYQLKTLCLKCSLFPDSYPYFHKNTRQKRKQDAAWIPHPLQGDPYCTMYNLRNTSYVTQYSFFKELFATKAFRLSFNLP